MYFKFCMMPLNQKLATMSPYGMGDTLYILQQWIIQVKPGGPAVPLKVMMVFLLLLYVYFYGFTYKCRLAKKLEKQAKNRYFDVTANFEY